MLAQRESYLSGFKDGYLTETSEKEHNGAPVQLKSPLIQLECQVFTQKNGFLFSFFVLILPVWSGGGDTLKISFHK